MAMLIGLVGKPNSGKSTMLKALTLADVKIANYPFTTINPNVATGYVVAECPCKSLGVECNPQNSRCVEGRRLIPVNLMDVAGLVPGAHLGKGLGNKFLDDLRQASALIHVVDCSGTTDEEGNAAENHDPSRDIEFLENEIEEWFSGILKKGMEKYQRLQKLEQADLTKIISEQVGGLGITPEQVLEVMEKMQIKDLGDDSLKDFARELRKHAKPILIACNKMDKNGSADNLEKIKSDFPEKIVVPCCAEAEIALRNAEKNGMIRYFPGSKSFEVISLNEKQKEAIGIIEKVIDTYGTTGVQQCLDSAVFDMLGYIVVYPVENENKFSNKKGEVLPDAMLMKKGSTVMDLARAVHTVIAEKFICAIDARTKRRVGADSMLKNNDIIKIVC